MQENEGRACLRLYRRADGTVLTRDCPVGLRGYQKRVARVAAAAFASILGLFSISYGQASRDRDTIQASKLAVLRSPSSDQKGAIKGTVQDPNGAVVAGADLTLTDAKNRDINTRSDAYGGFSFPSLAPGVYLLSVHAAGFRTLAVTSITVEDTVALDFVLTLPVDESAATLGVVGSLISEAITLETIKDLPATQPVSRPALTLANPPNRPADKKKPVKP